jgi:hypothetical protein
MIQVFLLKTQKTYTMAVVPKWLYRSLISAVGSKMQVYLWLMLPKHKLRIFTCQLQHVAKTSFI